MVLYLRYWSRSSHAFQTKQWKLVHVKNSSAQGLLETVEASFEDDDLDPRRVVSLATDGCNAMLGNRGGFQVLFTRKHNAHCLTAHCIGHKNALAAQNAVEMSPFATKLEAEVGDIGGYHSHSTKRTEHLESVQERIGMRAWRLLKIHKIRWLSRGRALTRPTGGST